MLKVDLGTLARKHRMRIDAEVPADDPLWDSLPWRFAEPVQLSLDLQQAGQDVVVRGGIEGVVDLACRRCLTPVTHELDEELTFLYRAGVQDVDAEAEEVYALPAKGSDLDLGPALREHVLL